MDQNKQIRINYTNHRQETRQRLIVPKEIFYGSTQWHPEEQWLLKAHDVEKGEERDFAFKDVYDIQPLVLPGINQPTLRSPPRVKEVKLYGDGGSRGNPGPSASGFVIMDMEGHILFEAGIYLGITTNNQAEYQALKFGLEQAKKNGCNGGACPHGQPACYKPNEGHF